MEKKPVPVLNQDFDLRLFLYVARRNMVWVAAVFLACAAAAFLYLRYTVPMYQSSTIIQLTDEEEDYKFIGEEKFNAHSIAQEIELLRSPVFLQRTLDSLPLEVTYFNRGRILDYDSYANSPYHTEIFVTNDQVHDVPIDITFTSITAYTIEYKVDEQVYRYEFIVNKPEVTEHFEIRTLVRDPLQVLDPPNQFFFRINKSSDLIARYSPQIRIEVLNEAAKTIRITDMDVNSNRASDIANGVAKQFEYFNLQKKKESLNQIIDYINETLGLVKTRLTEADSRLSTFKKENRIITGDLESSPLTSRNFEMIRQYESRKFEYEIQLLVLDDVIRKVGQKDMDIYEVLTMISQISLDGYVSSIVDNINMLIIRRDGIQQKVTENNRELKEINAQIDAQKRMLIESLSSIQGSFRDKIADLNRKIDELEKELYGQFGATPNDVELVELNRVYEIQQKYYNELITKKAEYELTREGYTSGYRVLQYSKPDPVPVSPRRNLILVSAFVVWLLLSLGIIGLKYLFNDRILSIADITRHSNAPILGVVAKYREDIPVSQLIVDKRPKSMMAESFRAIRANLEFISNEPGPKLISVTSTISGEGKTFIAINLAGILAFTGKTVIILDADMRKPKIHLGFNATNEKGLSTLLIGKDTIEDCTRKSELENLFYITAGPIPPNPSELLLGKRMDQLIETLLTRYDYVLIDNPPVGIVTDALTNMQKADYPIYIFRSDYSRKFFINNLERLINENKISRLSVILNGTEMGRSRYGYAYGYGNSYGYGSGYGYIDNGGGYYEEDAKQKKGNIFKRFRK